MAICLKRVNERTESVRSGVQMNGTGHAGTGTLDDSTRRRQVVVVDDDDLLRDEIAGLLSGIGYRVRTYAGADELLAADPDPSGVLVVDMRLKGMSGLLLQQKLAGRADIQFVFISGVAQVEDAVEAMKAGASEFLVKPFRTQALVDAVGKAFERLSATNADLTHVEAIRAAYDSLTETERAIALLLASGLRNKQVAYRSGKAENTVKVHRARIMQKMAASSLIELSQQLQRIGIVANAGPAI